MKYFFGIHFFLTAFITVSASARTLSPIEKDAPLPANRFVELAKLVNPAIVNISTTSMPRQIQGPGGSGRGLNRDPFFDLFEQFMNPYYGMPQQPMQALGTGFIIRKDGLIITNNHVVQQADIIKVQLDEKSKVMYEAEVIGRDEKTDIALIKIDAKKELPTIEFGSSKDLQVGEWVAAFGNPYGHGHTMTKGIISAIGREIDELNLFPFLQTDASINPGNSGGPLVNVQGQVIGVNTAIDARAQGIGFAIPIDNVKSLLPELENNGSIERGFIGVYMMDIDDEAMKELGLPQSEGALITQVIENSPAEKAKLKPYDLIVKLANRKVESTSDLAKVVASIPIGKAVDIEVIRNKKKQTLKISMGKHPSSSTPLVKKGKQKSYNGQNAPFDLGFRVADYSKQILAELNMPELRTPHPVIIEVKRGSKASMAGLAPGDVVLDINRKSVSTAKDVLKTLKKGTNIIRVLKQDRVAILYIR
ncbi:MAG: trypsin-like peptidase domain-containing protein [Bdellovibrionales bacterium]|nr:trypsin-like peptidase domain-containing protein [Bdellovibrionales bacterium]